MFLISGNNHLIRLFICFSGSQLLMPFLLAACHQHKSWSIMGLGTETGALVDVWGLGSISSYHCVILWLYSINTAPLTFGPGKVYCLFIVCMRCIFFGPYHSKLYLQLQLQSHLHSLWAKCSWQLSDEPEHWILLFRMMSTFSSFPSISWRPLVFC